MPVSKDNTVTTKPSLADFVLEKRDARKSFERRANHRHLSDAEYSREIGMIPQTFGRLINGEMTSMAVDQALILIKFYRAEVLPHFEYGEGSALEYPAAVALAGLYTTEPEGEAREETAKAILALGRMEPGRRKTTLDLIERLSSGEIDPDKFSQMIQAA